MNDIICFVYKKIAELVIRIVFVNVYVYYFGVRIQISREVASEYITWLTKYFLFILYYSLFFISEDYSKEAQEINKMIKLSESLLFFNMYVTKHINKF